MLKEFSNQSLRRDWMFQIYIELAANIADFYAQFSDVSVGITTTAALLGLEMWYIKKLLTPIVEDINNYDWAGITCGIFVALMFGLFAWEAVHIVVGVILFYFLMFVLVRTVGKLILKCTRKENCLS